MVIQVSGSINNNIIWEVETLVPPIETVLVKGISFSFSTVKYKKIKNIAINLTVSKGLAKARLPIKSIKS